MVRKALHPKTSYVPSIYAPYEVSWSSRDEMIYQSSLAERASALMIIFFLGFFTRTAVAFVSGNMTSISDRAARPSGTGRTARGRSA
jgi:hypothetical protein